MGIYDSGSGSPVDYQVLQQQIDQKRQLAQALLQRGLTAPQGQMVSGHYISPGVGGMLNQIATAMMGSKLQSDSNSDAQKLSGQYNSGLKDALQGYMETKMGQPGGAPTQIPTDGLDIAAATADGGAAPDQTMMAGGRDAVAANPRQAAINALASQYKPLQAMGQKDLAYQTGPVAMMFNQQGGSPLGVSASGGTPSATAATGAATGTTAAAGTAPTTPASPTTTGLPANVRNMFPRLNPQEIMSFLSADDGNGSGLAAAAKLNGERGNPIAGRGDGILTLGNDGMYHQSVPLNELAATTGTQTAAKLNAQNQGEFTTLKMPDGSDLNVSKAQLAQLTGQGPVAAGGVGTAPAAAQPLRFQGEDLLNKLPPEMKAGILQDMRKSDTSQTMLHVQHPQTGELISGQVNLGSGAVAAPAGSGNGAPATAPANPASLGFKTGITPATESEQKKIGEGYGNTVDTINSAANTAQIVKARVAQMRADSQGFQTGSLTDLKQTLGGLAIAVGADPDTVAAKIGNVSDMQSFNKEALSLAFDQVKTLGSREAMGVVNMALKANAGLTTQPDAASKIMGMVEGMADYSLAKQQALSSWQSLHGGSAAGFESNWNATQPITKYVDLSTLKAPTPKGGSGHIPAISPYTSGAHSNVTTPAGVMSLDDYLKAKGQ